MSARALKVAPVLGVSDVVKSVDYFCDSLGFECDRETSLYGGPEGAVYAVLQRGDKSVRMVPRSRTPTTACATS